MRDEANPQRNEPVSPLTLTLSPLRGEGTSSATPAHFEPGHSCGVSPSPLNGEKAGMRGEANPQRNEPVSPLTLTQWLPKPTTSQFPHKRRSLRETWSPLRGEGIYYSPHLPRVVAPGPERDNPGLNSSIPLRLGGGHAHTSPSFGTNFGVVPMNFVLQVG